MYENSSLRSCRFVMIISLLVRIICNDVSAVQSIIPVAKDSFRMQDNNAERKQAMVKRSNWNEQAFDERFGKNVDLNGTFDDRKQKETKSLAQKLANEALGSPQLQRNIKKLANLSGTLHNHSKGMKGLGIDQMKSVLKPTVNKRKLNKLLNRKGKEKRKRDKRKHRLRQREHPWLRKRNRTKVNKRKIFLLKKNIYFKKCKNTFLSKS